MHALTHLNIVDWIIIALYFMFVLGLGVFAQTRTKNSNDFFMAGRKNNSWIAGLAFLSANMGALELLGMAGQSYQYGIMTAHFYFIGAVPAMLFLAIYMMPFYYSKKITSIPGYLKERYNESTRRLNAVAFAIMTLLMAGINMYSMALVLHVFVGWNFQVSMWVSSATVAAYIFLGGLSSAIFSEVMQFFLIWFGMLLAVILGYVHIGGWHEITTRLPSGFHHLWANTGHAVNNPMKVDYIGIVFGLGFVLSFGYWTTDFLVIQRAFSAKDLRSAQMAPIIASFFKMALPFLVVTAGILVKVFFVTHQIPKPDRSDDALLYLINMEYPHGLLGFGVTALLAGFMAGQAGNISAFNTVFTHDIYKAMIVKKASDQHYLHVGRVMTLVGVLISVGTAYWALDMPNIMDYIQVLFSIVNAPLFGVILVGMFWRRMNGIGAFTGLFCGMALALTLFLLGRFGVMDPSDVALTAASTPMAQNFWRAVWVWLCATVVTIIVSMLTKPLPKKQIEPYVYSGVTRAAYGDIVWYHRPMCWAVISLILLVVLDVVFW